uniref:Titin n=1 Tax=Sinocyclocheilus grahami TaxID=75366 RepID=A0A672NYG7_SINGR
MVITWQRPTNDGGNAITGYIVEKRDKEGVRWARCNKRVVSELRFRVTGLLENRSYEFRVSAENAAGVGKPSPPTVYFKAVDQVFKPGPPNNPKVIDVSRASVVLHWGKPIYDGGCEIQSYIVEAFEVTSDEWMMCTPPSGITETRFEVKKLLEKHEYKFRICAINKVGVGETADIPGSIIIEDKLEAPDIDLDADLRKMITVRAGGSLRLFVPIRGRPTPEVKWGKAEGEINEAAQIDITSSFTSLIIENVNRFDSGKYTLTLENASGTKSAFISVRVLDNPDAPANFHLPEGRWMKASFANILETEFTVTGLIEDCKYDFRVIARNGAGSVSRPSMSTGSITAKDEVEPPTYEVASEYSQILTVNAGDTFTLEASILGKPVPTMQWFKSDVEVENSARAEIKNTDFKAILVVKDAIRIDGGQYTLHLTNVAGTKSVSFSVRVLDRPGPPEGPFSVSGVTCEKCSLSWLPPKHDGGSSISHYIIQKRETSRLAWTVVSGDCGATMFKVTKLLKGNEYIFRVMAVNKYGVGEPLESAPVNMRNPFVPSGPPKELEVTNISRDSMTVCWTRPETDGGSSPIIGYHLERKEKNSILWTKLNKLLIADTRFKTNGLEEGIEYEYKVFAENMAGISPSSKVSESVVARDPCDPPGTPEAIVITRNLVTLQWAKPQYDGGSAITGYIIERKKLPEGRWMKASFTNIIHTQFTITGLEEEQRYEFRVIAKNAAGNLSVPSESTGPITAQDEIEAPSVSMDSKFKDVITVKAGESFSIDADIAGKPLPDIMWLKDGKEIDSATPRMEIKSTITQTVLTVKDCIRVDGGHFLLSLSNVGGTKQVPISVKVLDRPGPPDGPLNVTGVTAEKLCTPPTGVQTTHFTVKTLKENAEYNFRICALNIEGAGEHVDVPGSVIAAEKLEAPEIELDADLRKCVTVRASATLRLFVAIRGRPEPEVKWTKADGTLPERAQIEVTGSYTVLVIDNVNRFDTGKYVPPQIDGGARITHYIVEKRESKR